MSNKLLSRADLLPVGGRILCALSGGPDSVAMTHALCAFASQRQLTVAAAHFSHGLRPAAAEAERALCRALCDRLGIPLFCGSGDTVSYATAQKCTTEEAARALRYAFLQQTAAEWQADCIATGHHRGDQAETVLFHLARGSGLSGLRGIPAKRGNIIRPMLDTSKAQILDYLQTHQLAYSTDESNDDAVYSRNRIRHRVLPQLEAAHPGAAHNIAACARRLAADEDCLSGLAEQALQGEQGGIGLERLLTLHPAVQMRVLQRLYSAASHGETLSQVHLDAILALCHRGGAGRIDLPGNLSAKLETHRLTVEVPRMQTASPAPIRLQPEQMAQWGDWELCFTTDPDARGAIFDATRITFPVLVRSREDGDCIPLDASAHKSVKKLLNECKIPVDMRDSIPILCDNKGVLAVADLRTDPTRRSDLKRDTITLICRRIKKWHTT